MRIQTLSRASTVWLLALPASVLPAVVSAQNAVGTANIHVRPNLGTQSRDQFTVCTGTTANRALYGTKVTTSTGDLTFSGINSGIEVVTTVTKPGYTGREQKWLVPPPGGARDVTIYMFSGTGGPTCPGSAAPAPAPPPPVSVQVTVDPGTAAKDGFYVCVGHSTNREAHGKATTTSTGTVSFSFVPTTAMLKATVVKAGYKGVERDWYPTPGQSVVFNLPIATGTPVYTCPGYTPPVTTTTTTAPTSTEVTVSATPLYALPPDVRLGEEKLSQRGQFSGTVTTSTTDCTASSYRNVMIGVEGAIMDTVIKTIKVSCTTVRDAITNEKRIPRGNSRGFMDYYSRCSPGRVLVGFSGTLAHGQLRSIRVVCQTMGTDGRVTGSTTTLSEIGKAKATVFGPDNCNGGRSGKAVKTASGTLSDGLPAGDQPLPTGVLGLQLTCEQPRID